MFGAVYFPRVQGWEINGLELQRVNTSNKDSLAKNYRESCKTKSYFFLNCQKLKKNFVQTCLNKRSFDFFQQDNYLSILSAKKKWLFEGLAKENASGGKGKKQHRDTAGR